MNDNTHDQIRAALQFLLDSEVNGWDLVPAQEAARVALHWSSDESPEAERLTGEQAAKMGLEVCAMCEAALHCHNCGAIRVATEKPTARAEPAKTFVARAAESTERENAYWNAGFDAGFEKGKQIAGQSLSASPSVPEPTQRGNKAHHIPRNTPVTIVTTFNTLGGELRYVVDFDAVPGLLHIESPARLRFHASEPTEPFDHAHPDSWKYEAKCDPASPGSPPSSGASSKEQT